MAILRPRLEREVQTLDWILEAVDPSADPFCGKLSWYSVRTMVERPGGLSEDSGTVNALSRNKWVNLLLVTCAVFQTQINNKVAIPS